MLVDNFAVARKRMVEEQIISRGVTDERVINALLKIPRHLFVEPALLHLAHNDYPLPIGENQTISQPYMVAAMTELLTLGKDSRVLEIGTGSGYQTAVLAEIAGNVYTIERIQSLARSAKLLLRRLGYLNIAFRTGDGSLGWREFAPYDGILVTAGATKIPQVFLDQLGERGHLVIPLGERGVQKLILVTKQNDALTRREIFDCEFVPLIGRDI